MSWTLLLDLLCDLVSTHIECYVRLQNKTAATETGFCRSVPTREVSVCAKWCNICRYFLMVHSQQCSNVSRNEPNCKWTDNNQNYHRNRCSILFTWRELLRTGWSNMSAIFTKSSNTLQKWENLGEYPSIFSTLQLGRNIIFLSTLTQLLSTGGSWIQHWSSWGQCQRPRVSSG